MSIPEAEDVAAPIITEISEQAGVSSTSEFPSQLSATGLEDENQKAPAPEQSKLDPKMKICGVCNVNDSKYKCTRCFLPYCSVACSTLHRATHPAIDITPAATPETNINLNSNPSASKPLAGTLGFRDPFAALEGSSKIQELFKLFPRLPQQLDDIYSATLRPLDDQTDNNRSHDFTRGMGKQGRGDFRKSKEPWNSERGIQNGIQALCRAREAYGKDGEGIREFSKLVLQILSGDGDAITAAELVEKELAQENTNIILQLLQNES